jgi:CheY-like chemotaxis protein
MNKVLVVDDEPDIVYVVRVILRSAGFDVVAAASVDEALAQVAEDEPDLILLDLRLGKEEGWRLLETLHDDGRTARIPIVIVTAHGGRDSADRATRNGARGFLTKPFVASNLVETVRTYVTTS